MHLFWHWAKRDIHVQGIASVLLKYVTTLFCQKKTVNLDPTESIQSKFRITNFGNDFDITS